jgi:hypothetical protein
MRTLYLSALFSLAMLFMVFGSSPSHADEDQRPGHLIILADHSGSMHRTHTLSVQAEALVAALDAYVSDCSNTTVTYIAWGNLKPSIRTIPLNNSDARYDLILHILETANLNLMGTDHRGAFEVGRSVIKKGERVVMIQMTDDVADPYDTESIGFTIHKVAIGSAAAAKSLEEEFLPGQGETHYVANSQELEEMLGKLLDTVRNDLCLG